MDRIERPILYPGFVVDDAKVIRRLSSNGVCEIYLMDNGKHLRLFGQVADGCKALTLNGHTYGYSYGTQRPPKRGNIVHSNSDNSVGVADHIKSQTGGFKEVAGMAELKRTLRRDIIEPLRHADRYRKFRLSLPNGMLLFGPPGCGKTFIVQKLAEEIGYNFIKLKHSDVVSKWAHETVENIGTIFEHARIKAPSIVFIDEIEGIAPNRASINSNYKNEEINELLMQINNAGKHGVLVIGASNQPDLIDPALIRPGRMDRLVYVGPPDVEARIEMFKLALRGRPSGSIDYRGLADATNGYASADITYIVEEAARLAVVSNAPFIDMSVLKGVIDRTPSSISATSLARYNKYKSMQR